MDFLVEATVLLDVFPDQAAVHDVLRSHGFALTDLGGGQVRVKGFFRDLKAAKASLEPLLAARTASPVPVASSGAAFKLPGGGGAVTGRGRGRDRPRSSPNHASPPPPSPNRHLSSVSPPGRRGPSGPGRESFVVDADVLRYAEQLRAKDLSGILLGHGVEMEPPREDADGCESRVVVLLGKSARAAAAKLQSLLEDLGKSLRTQEVPLRDMDRDGHALWRRIRSERGVHQAVVVRPTADKLHLIGPPAASYELKQRLLGGSGGRTGRTSEKNSKRRSASLPPIRRGATAEPSPPRPPRGGSPPGFGQGRASRGRSPSESRKNIRVVSACVQETPPSHKKALLNFVNDRKTDIKKKMSSLKKRK
ncbi:uncharacterized protein LOC130192782 [Pseudoliparis swirei]|uniref:uncharacterized protein LOC130192782 n=1 Tax=Pseudoliparis swirei TaxID=2059687 RepID=UPI0024BE00BD|nr:uncharacterized protein LOC130192782 [Pseudoliparis swirei]XP_056268923.1 uncharacterized protein LOC130192782 [Pseudoliparis swirei]XP_056268930.1 uncharacterized protein LOC130192782 [Pseudoliparis swirei]XP_056268939.1 uncharacterized protein LOC130192782 [Pseudoliparis swirei]